ncbi:MAG: hypothetical protein K2X38_19630 [Gemmataceae bacterium]|nr:hypothetical protein [Gemmataceae bacterium]
MAIVLGGGLLLTLARLLPASERPSTISLVLYRVSGIAFFAALAGLVIGYFASAAPEVLGSLAMFAVAYLVAFVLPSPVIAHAWGQAASFAQKKWGRVALASMILASFVGASTAYVAFLESNSDAPFGDTMNFGDDLEQDGHAASSEESPLYTDRGEKIAIRKIFTGTSLQPAIVERQMAMLQRFRLREQVIQIPGGWQPCNCHGFTFADGQFWIPGGEVPKILSDNGYVEMQAPKPGDVAVYRNAEEEVIHTGIVHSANSEIILVESKWGRMGRFIHPHNRHCYIESTCTFYRSRRAGNTVQGVPPHDGSLFPERPDPAMLHHMLPRQFVSQN